MKTSIAIGLFLLINVSSGLSQLSPITFVFGTASDTNGAASETSLRNGLTAVVHDIVATHNQNWLQVSNNQLINYTLQQDMWAQLEGISANTYGSVPALQVASNMLGRLWVDLKLATNILGQIRTNSEGHTFYLSQIHGSAREILYRVGDVFDQAYATAFTLTNTDTRLLRLTNITTGMSNLSSASFTSLLSLSNLLVQMTNKESIQINLDSAMSNSLYQINSAASWNSYIAENTKQATNFLSLLLQQQRADTNWHSLNAQRLRDIATNTLVATNFLAGIDQRLYGLTTRADSNNYFLSQISDYMRTNNSSQRSIFEVVSSNLTHVQATALGVLGTLLRATNSTDAMDPKVGGMLQGATNQMYGNFTVATNILAAVASGIGSAVFSAPTEARPSVFDMTIGGVAFNADPVQHAGLSPLRNAGKTFFRWTVIFSLFWAVFHVSMVYLRDGAISKTPQIGGLHLELWGFSAGAVTAPIYMALAMTFLGIMPTMLVTYLTDPSFLQMTLGEVLTGPMNAFVGISGVIYFVNGFFPMDTLAVAVINYFLFRIACASINSGIMIVLRSMVR